MIYIRENGILMSKKIEAARQVTECGYKIADVAE